MSVDKQFEIVVGGRRVHIDTENQKIHLMDEEGKTQSVFALQVAAGSPQGHFIEVNGDNMANPNDFSVSPDSERQ